MTLQQALAKLSEAAFCGCPCCCGVIDLIAEQHPDLLPLRVIDEIARSELQDEKLRHPARFCKHYNGLGTPCKWCDA